MSSRRWLCQAKATSGEWLREACKGALREEGNTIIETAICSSLVLSLLFGVIQICFALYTYSFIDEAAREATRYAAVRGSNSCTIAPSFPNCNLSPATSGNPIQDYIRGRAYPGIKTTNLTASPTWWTATTTNAGGGAYSTTSWTTQCTSGTCNGKRNAVQVVVTYSYPLNIPLWKKVTLNLTSTSRMVISE